jgi:anti-sigma factor RsiW
MSGPCLGDTLTALVDGELDHGAREKAFAHLAGCAGCRGEVDAQRRLKARLASLDRGPLVPPALTGRLLGLAVPGADLSPRAVPGRPVPVAPPVRGDSRRPGDRRATRSTRLRRRQATGVLVAVSLGAALALGGPGGGAASTPLDPGADVFVVDHASTTGRLPLREPAARVVTLPAR